MANIQHAVLNTGQHYDAALAGNIFTLLSMPKPDYNLGCGSGSQASQTARMLTAIEEVLLANRPNKVVLYGDTNSTLAGALAAAKLQIPIAHIEAGMRSYNRAMPEEINRVVTDHLSDTLFCSSALSEKNLHREGITRNTHVTGDVMADVFERVVNSAAYAKTSSPTPFEKGTYALLTLHRAALTEDLATLRRLLDILENQSRALPIFFPVHPRTIAALKAMGWQPGTPSQFVLAPPCSYLEMQRAISDAKIVLTDSGGVQKEAYWHGTPCITLRTETEWVELVEMDYNRLAGSSEEKILAALAEPWPSFQPGLYGNGRAAHAILSVLGHLN